MTIMARERPAAVPAPAARGVTALTPPGVFERFGDEAAGVRALSGGDNVITMLDVIGADYWSGGGVTAAAVARQLRAIGDRPVEVQINSPGGDMFEGIAIYNILREHPQTVTVKVVGIAASAASIITMAGDEVQIGAASFLMIHNCWVLAIGNQFDFREMADYLAPFDAAMAGVYAMRSGQPIDKIEAWMAAGKGDGTYFSGTQAVDLGFADALLPSDQIKHDAQAAAHDRGLNAVRAAELSLVHSGHTRTKAREIISQIKGTPGAAPAATPGAGETEWLHAAADFLAKLKG